jgi:hypothetical protein
LGGTPFLPAFIADREVQVMTSNKHGNEARKAFRGSASKGPLTEYQKEQEALRKNLERLRTERLAREQAATPKKD